MPEYLSPGVYVEEVDTGSKPIEGVSTSTAGLIGVTERGPVDVPILITSVGDFDRWFGGKLDRLAYTNGADHHCYLPDAVEGFFANGGKRVYITRVAPTNAVHATATLHAVNPDPTAVSAATTLLRNAGLNTGLDTEPLVVLDGADIALPVGLTPGDILRVGNGSSAEYRQTADLVPASLPDATIIVLTHAIQASFAAGTPISTLDPVAAPTYTVSVAAVAGATALSVIASVVPAAASAPAVDRVVRVGSQLCTITQVTPGATTRDFDLVIEPGLGEAAAVATPVTLFAPPVQIAYSLAVSPIVGNVARIVAAAPPGAAAPQQGDKITIDAETFTLTTVAPAVVNPTTTFDVTLSPAPSGAPHALNASVIFEPAGLPLSLDADAGSLALVISANPPIAATKVLLVPNGAGGSNPHAIGTPIRVTFTTPLPADAELGSLVRRATTGPPTPPLTLGARTSTALASVGDSGIVLDARIELRAGQLLAIDSGTATEYRLIRALPSRNTVGNDPGLVVLDRPLGLEHVSGTTAQVVVTTPSAAPGSALLEPATAGATSIAIAGLLAAGNIVEVVHSDGTRSVVTVDSTAAITPALIALDAVLQRAHRSGEEVVERVPLLDVSAIDSGIWGNRLRIAVQHEGVGLVAPTVLRERVDATHVRLGSSVGVEAGTVLELLDRDGNPTDALLKIDSIDRQDNDKITLAAPLTAQQQFEITAAGPANLLSVRSREFRLTVELLHQRDAARPLRNEMVIASEVYPNLSMDPRHSRYVQNVIGDSDPAAPKRLVDRRSFGESRFIRVHDVAFADPPSAASLVARVGPEALVGVLPTGVRRPARLALAHGDDLISTMDDDAYIGLDNVVPELRTGLQSFRNIDAISIVGCPGRTSVKMQSALINHCEELRYRFAVLDCFGPPDDTISDVQSQRQNYDSKYAALYYPWMMVPQVFPTNLAVTSEEALPPSGHILGVFARTDIERGVHKAPANEVVRGGISNLRRTINKSEHDILNPFPTNINVIRDFRHDNRAIRVYGARVMTSDPDWKYVNVRRLLIFIEKSIDLGLQWVVFEPNAEPLWARVNRSVSNFLTTVWRNGALEGVTKAEAYFVKCDRTTMTQTDIDNGRLIIEVGVAPVKPAEFVIVRIGLFTAHADD